MIADAKTIGSFYTPDEVARTLVRWVVRSERDLLLDPSCGDGAFLQHHPNAIGVEREPFAAAIASQSAPGSTVIVDDFFRWADDSNRRFDCVAGNPPFVRYQIFAGETRRRAIEHCATHGARFSGLTSSWAPFLVAAAAKLRPGGRMAFVVPAEIGHAPYALPLLDFLKRSFGRVLLIAFRDKIFPQLSQDVWLLFAEGFGERTDVIEFSRRDRFKASNQPPAADVIIHDEQLRRFQGRLRPFLLPAKVAELYSRLDSSDLTYRLRDVARIGIGYVTGANDFFHLRPSAARTLGIPSRVLAPTVRNGRNLPPTAVTPATLAAWARRDESFLLLRLAAEESVPAAVARYLETEFGRSASVGYKCRNRTPWYAVPDVIVPDGFLSYMSGRGPHLVANRAGCVCTNSVHMVRLRNGSRFGELQRAWRHPLASLSAEVEGHPLGGGMLKLEPREASALMLPRSNLRLTAHELDQLEEGIQTLRRWRHYD